MNKLILLLLLAIALTGAFILGGKFTEQNTKRVDTIVRSAGSHDEEELSQKEVPADVMAAMDLARTTGKPVLGIRADGPTFRVPVLVYHYVEHVRDGRDKIRISLNILPEVLDRQITTLQQAGYTFLTAADLADVLDGIKDLPAKSVVLTFDDGYRDFYTDAFPILKKHNVRAVAYIVSGFIDRPNYLTTEQLQEIAGSGLVEIGAHTILHRGLAIIPREAAREEIEGSKIQLERRLGIPITAFAYPYGSFNLETIQMVKQAGFRTAASTITGTQLTNGVRFFIRRLHPGHAVGSELIAILEKK